jgi:hypothetical protein
MTSSSLQAALWGAVMLVACGGREPSDIDKGTTDSGADTEVTPDAAPPHVKDGSPRCEVQAFADRVRAVPPSGSQRALPLPQDRVDNVDAARSATRKFVAKTLAIAPEDLSLTVVECGTPTSALCSSKFNHDTLNTPFSMALSPVAEELENCAALDEMTWWNAPDGSKAVCLAGIDDGYLIGIAAFSR